MGVFVLALLAGGCAGELEVWIVDPSLPEDDELVIASLELPLDRVQAHTRSGWVALDRGPNPYNLLDFEGSTLPIELAGIRDAPARLAIDEVLPERIDALRLLLVPGEPIVLEDGFGVEHPVTVEEPSDSLRAAVALHVSVEGGSEVTLGLDVRAALTESVGGGYTFRPELVPIE